MSFRCAVRRFVLVLAAGVLSHPGRLVAQDVLVDISDLSPHEVRLQGFALEGTQEVRIRAAGTDDRWRGRDSRWWNRFIDDGDYAWHGNAWILDARTREPVWELSRADWDRDRDIYRFEGEVTLPGGSYVAFFASYTGEWRGHWDRDWDRDRRRSRWYDYGISEEFEFRLEGSGRQLSRSEVAELRQDLTDEAIVSFVGLEYGVMKRVGLEVSQPTEVEIYAVGEALDEASYDYAWIVDLDTGRPVWRMDYWNTMHAGGAEKNRVARRKRVLDAGRYLVLVATDDSHDAFDWNAPPPYDPEFWGLTLTVVNPRERGNVTVFDPETTLYSNAIVDLTGMRDRERETVGFSLSRPLRVRVRALGEGIDGQMYDQGWIVDAETRRRVWEMDYYDTEHAGGAAKNRMIDEVIELEAGNYLVYYVSDDSHSYRRWNSAPPVEPEAWGIALYPDQEDFQATAVGAYDPEDDASILAQITMVGDHEYERVRFELEEPSEVRVFALGEGLRRRMYDYAWIEDERGRTVWEMRYRDTRHAGGARKNRQLNETIELAAGSYTLFYESDGSHSFEDWNAAPPDEPFFWGVTLYRN